MNLPLLFAILGKEPPPAAEPPADLRPVTPDGWERAAFAEPFPMPEIPVFCAPTCDAPVRGRIVSQAKGPNRAQRRAKK